MKILSGIVYLDILQNLQRKKKIITWPKQIWLLVLFIPKIWTIYVQWCWSYYSSLLGHFFLVTYVWTCVWSSLFVLIHWIPISPWLLVIQLSNFFHFEIFKNNIFIKMSVATLGGLEKFWFCICLLNFIFPLETFNELTLNLSLNIFVTGSMHLEQTFSKIKLFMLNVDMLY